MVLVYLKQVSENLWVLLSEDNVVIKEFSYIRDDLVVESAKAWCSTWGWTMEVLCKEK